MTDRRPRRVPRREADRVRPKPVPLICWPMLHVSSPEFLGAYNRYLDRMNAMGQEPFNSGEWYRGMVAGFGR